MRARIEPQAHVAHHPVTVHEQARDRLAHPEHVHRMARSDPHTLAIAERRRAEQSDQARERPIGHMAACNDNHAVIGDDPSRAPADAINAKSATHQAMVARRRFAAKSANWPLGEFHHATPQTRRSRHSTAPPSGHSAPVDRPGTDKTRNFRSRDATKRCELHRSGRNDARKGPGLGEQEHPIPLVQSPRFDQEPLTPMSEPRKTPSNYRSGTDYTMEFGKYRFRFSARDFRERCEFAAVQLAFVPSGSLKDADVEQLVQLVAHGHISSDGGLQDHIAAHREELIGFDDDLVHWLRKLVFRGAWVDQQIKDELVEPVLDDFGTFTYRCAVTNDPIEEIADTPDWSNVGYRMERR